MANCEACSEDTAERCRVCRTAFCVGCMVEDADGDVLCLACSEAARRYFLSRDDDRFGGPPQGEAVKG